MSVVPLNRKPEISYFLLGKKIYFIVNANAKSGNISTIIRKLSKHFPLYAFNVVLSSSTHMATEITREVFSENVLFIVMGGDGTANNAVQYMINTKAVFGLIPKGTANDLATAFKIPNNIDEALRIISAGHITHLNAIRINNSFVLTVGGVGLPARVAHAVNCFKRGSPIRQFVHRCILRSSIYKIFVFLLLIRYGSRAMQYNGTVDVNGKRVFEGTFVALFFGKQEFVGKSFLACPEIRHEDLHFKLSLLRFTGFWRGLWDVIQISKAKSHKVKNLLSWNAQSARVQTDAFLHLLGDGEILDHEDEFIARHVPHAVRLITKES